jgi:phosphoribosylaminoimidazole-succinocarboxamide synthase
MGRTTTVFETDIAGMTRLGRGKVRDIYAAGPDHLLIVTTDRISAFDVVLPTPIPGKGEVLTALSEFWFDRTEGVVANHRSSMRLEDVVRDRAVCAALASRAVVVKRLRPLPIEAI